MSIFNNNRTKAKLKYMMKRHQVHAPALVWGRWLEVYAQLGVTGPDADQHVTKVKLSIASETETQSSFDYEIKGGDYNIRGVVGSSSVSETVPITGNVATSIKVRAKSHSLQQRVIVTIRG
jgi:hypothetical protein